MSETKNIPLFQFRAEVGLTPEKTAEWAEQLRSLADKVESKAAQELTVIEAVMGMAIAGVAVGMGAAAKDPVHNKEIAATSMEIGAILPALAILGEEVTSRIRTGKGTNIERPVINPVTKETIPVSDTVLPFMADALRWMAKAVDGSGPIIAIDTTRNEVRLPASNKTEG